VQRVITEAAGRRYSVDVVETNGPEMEMIAREKPCRVFSPYLADLPAHAIPTHRMWIPDRMNFFVVGYNTAKVKRAEIPTTAEGFTDPKWKGRIGLEATDAERMATLIKTSPGDKGMDLDAQALGVAPGASQRARCSPAGCGRRGAGGPMRWQQQHRDAEAQGRADRLRPRAAGRCAAAGDRRRAKRAAPERGAACLRTHALSPEGQKLFESMGRVPRARR
jgi:iron(III) transport system substrate-binding protein